jgi:GNAT superfamily N-acetyltransferase
MERDSAEYIVEPWVIDRHTLVAVERDRVVAAVHMKRYGSDDRVSASYRDAAAIDWIVFDPGFAEVGKVALEGAIAHLRRWNARIWYADGNLPCLGVYGVPDAWPHVQQLLIDGRFDDSDGQVEVVFAGSLHGIDPPGPPPMPNVELRRAVGPLGTSFEAWLHDKRIGVFEIEDFYGITNSQLARWADEGNHWVVPEHRGAGIGTWLARHGCEWLRLAGKDRLLTYAIEASSGGPDWIANEPTAENARHYYARFGLVPITRTRRGWRRAPD